MNTEKGTPTDAEQEFTGTSVPLHTLLHWNAEDVQVELRRALAIAGNVYTMSKEIDKCLALFPESGELQDIFDKVSQQLDADQQETITRLIIGLRKLENL